MRPSAPPSNTKSPPTTRSTHQTKKAQKQSFLSDPAFIQGYRDAFSTIYERNDYASAIDQLRALGHDDYANVANLIGYSYRKLERLQAVAGLVRTRAQIGSEPCPDLELLRSVADRAGQPRAGGISFDPDRCDLRNRLRGVSVFGGGAGKAARRKSRLLSIEYSRNAIQRARRPRYV